MRKVIHVVPTPEKEALYHITASGVWQWLTAVCAVIISSSAYILMARTLDPRYFGSYLFVQWLATIVAPTIGAGMSTVVSQQIAAIQCRESPRMIAGIFYFLWYRQHRRILLYCLLYLLLAFSLSSFFHLYPFSQLLLAGLSTLPLLLSNVAGTTLRSLRRSDLLTMLQLVTVLLSLLLIIFAIQINGKPIEAFQLAFALASTLTLILAVICVIHLLPLEKALQPGIFLKERLQHSLTHSRLFFFPDVIIWQRGEFLFLASHCKPADIGFYMLSSIISSSAISLAPFILANIIEPMKVSKNAHGTYPNAYDSFIKTSCYLVFLAVPLCILLILFSPNLVIFCLGNSYKPLVNPLRIMLIATGFGSVATASVTHLATLPDQHSTQVRLQFFIALLKINLVLILSAHWGITGAAIASTLAQILSAFHSILFCRHTLLKHEPRF
jgi:O-antigen/teichoic acid export membrane protein